MSISSNLSFSPPSSGKDRADVANEAKEQTEEKEVVRLRNSTISNNGNGAVDGSSAGVADSETASEHQQQHAMTSSVSDSQHPEAHLEALDTIITCTTLQQTTSGEGQASIAALLRQAKSLLLDNTVTVILATLRELHRPEEEGTTLSASFLRLPAFWSHVRSSKELTAWLQLFDMILYCWGGQRGEAPAFVERYVRAYTEEIRHLRQLHDFDSADLVDDGAGGVRRVQERLNAVKSALRPAHWTLVAGLKKFNRAKLEELWYVLTACLQLCGCLEMPSPPGAANSGEKDSGQTNSAILPLDEMKKALTKLTFADLDRLADFEKLAANASVIDQLRHQWLPSAHFNEAKLHSLDLTSMANKAWHGVPGLAADFVAYLRGVEELARLRERLAMRQEATIPDAIYVRLLTMAAGQLTSIRRHQQWQKVPKVLKETITERRQSMSRRCSVVGGGADDTLLSPTSSTASSAATTSSLSFSVDLESSIPINWNMTIVKNPMVNILNDSLSGCCVESISFS